MASGAEISAEAAASLDAFWYMTAAAAWQNHVSACCTPGSWHWLTRPVIASTGMKGEEDLVVIWNSEGMRVSRSERESLLQLRMQAYKAVLQQGVDVARVAHERNQVSKTVATAAADTIS